MSYLKNRKKAQTYLRRASRLSNAIMMGHRPFEEAMQDYRIVMDELQQESEDIQFLFALMVQDRTDIAIMVYYQMSRTSEEIMAELLPANLEMTQMCYNTICKSLGPMANSRIKFLTREFNKLPVEHPENPRKTIALYRRAFKK